MSPQASIDVYDRTSSAHQEALGHDVTLVGYGRYGRLHIGPKYATNSTLWNMAAIVDPLLTRPQQFDQLSEEVTKHGVKAAVASQWHYSDLPRLIRREIKRLAGQPHVRLADVRLQRVELEFSKENGAAISATPPLSELPHAIQLLESIGLVDLAQHQPEVSCNEVSVEAVYRPTNITDGIHVRASLDWTPDEWVKVRSIRIGMFRIVP